MRINLLYLILGLNLIACNKQNKIVKPQTKETVSKHSMISKPIDPNIPTIGILIFEGVILNEVLAPLDVFSYPDTDGKKIFNVITIATEDKMYKSAHGLQIRPDYLTKTIPDLKVLVVPSSYTTEAQTSDKKLISFIKTQNSSTDYIASHCAGAFLIGETGIADNKEIVTYVSGGASLKKDYPKLKVADDSKISVVKDGKFISSNGSLVSYLASFDLLEELTSLEHRKHVETAILYDRLITKNQSTP